MVIPAYREQSRIAATLGEVRRQLAAVDGLEIVVVDDGSGDDGARIAEASGADQVIVHPRNRGKGAALRSGFAAATGRVVAFTDADLAYAPGSLLGFCEAIEQGADAAIGSRRLGSSEPPGGRSLLRTLGSRLVNTAARVVLARSYGDTQCGCKAFSGDVAEFLASAGTVDGFGFDIEVLHLVEHYGLTLRELPVDAAHRDTSTVRIADGVRLLVDIARIRRRSRAGAYPALDPAIAGRAAGC